MKIVESWLREWVDPDLDSKALEHQLTMLGLEVDGVEVGGLGLEGVVVAEVLEVAKHPDADRLSVCKVRAGDTDTAWAMASSSMRATRSASAGSGSRCSPCS